MDLNLQNLPFFNKVSLRDRAFLARQLATMLSAGVAIDRTLRLLADRIKHPAIKAALAAALIDIEAGQKFSQAIAKHPAVFDSIMVNLVIAGEASGKLDEVLIKTADWLEDQSEFMSRLKNALIYPIFIVVVMLIIVFLMMTNVVPKLQEIFASYEASLPWTTKALISISLFCAQYWWVVILLVIALVWAAFAWVKTPAGRRFFDKIKIKDPTGLGMDVNMARFSRTLNTLMRSGVPIIQALEITAKTINNVWYEEILKKSIADVERGIPLSAPLSKSDLFPPIVSEMLAVGEQTGKIDDILYSISVYYDTEVNNKLKGITSLIEPALIVVVGLGVAFLVFAIIMPIYNLARVI